MYRRHARCRSRSITAKYSVHLFLAERAIGQLGQLAHQAARVRQMVGDADAIKTVLAVKIHNLRHATACRRNNLNECENRRAASGRDGRRRSGRRRPHHALRRGLKQLDRLAAGRVVARLAQHEFGDAQRGIGLADPLQIFTPFVPLRGAFGKGLFHQFGDFAVFLPDRAEVRRRNQFRVAFLLAGNDLVDDHRAARGDGFLHGRAARLADDQMMRQHQFGHLIRPAEHAHAVGVFARPFNQLRAQFGIAAGA